jgi:hypothetical protein
MEEAEEHLGNVPESDWDLAPATSAFGWLMAPRLSKAGCRVRYTDLRNPHAGLCANLGPNDHSKPNCEIQY